MSRTAAAPRRSCEQISWRRLLRSAFIAARWQRAIEPEQVCRCIDENDAPRRLVWDPIDQPLHAIAIRDFVLVRHERPVARPYELLRTASLEQRIDVATWIGAALTIRRGELDPGVARAHAVEDCLEAATGNTLHRIGTAEMIDHHFGATLANGRQDLREERAFEIDLDMPVELAHFRE